MEQPACDIAEVPSCAPMLHACRQPTRTRFKLIPRVANVEPWARDAPLSTPEYKLLKSYNDKPVLTRPQQRWRPPPLLGSADALP